MSPSVLLPCSRHRSCRYHKHWNPPSSTATLGDKNSTAVNTIPINSKSVQKKRILFHHRGSSTSPILSPLQRLPNELLSLVLAYLTPLDKASLALTCHTLAIVLGSDVWNAVSKSNGASWRQHDEFLDVLEPDLTEGYWRCKDCVLFHPRQQADHNNIRKNLLHRSSSLNKLRRYWQNDEVEALRLGIEEDPLYVLDFNLVKAVMDRHFLRERQGVCLNSMKCAGTRIFPVSNVTDYILRYDFTSKIVLDRLLLRATYTFSPHHTMYIQNMQIDEAPIDAYFDTIDFAICPHERLRMSSETLKNQAQYCPYCPTQYTIEMHFRSVTVRVYHNLGSGRSVKDERWKHIAQQRGNGIKTYAWGKEDVMGAFERIMCSTKEEFEKQVEKSDGRGYWYDPQMKRRSYRTLPVSLAESL